MIAGPAVDELDAIETVVDRYESALREARHESESAHRSAEERIREHGTLISQVSAALTHSLDEIRLPLHILLENRFGDLNENQEEMLETARAAAEAGGADLRRLGEVGDLDRGALVLRRDRVHVADVIQSLRPTLETEGSRVGVQLQMDIAPALPAMVADRSRLQEALALILSDCVRRTPAGGHVRIGVASSGSALVLAVDHGAAPAFDVGTVLAVRLLEAHGATVERTAGRTVMLLPTARAASPAPE
jgi:signal transduction histidine kinase